MGWRKDGQGEAGKATILQGGFAFTPSSSLTQLIWYPEEVLGTLRISKSWGVVHSFQGEGSGSLYPPSSLFFSCRKVTWYLYHNGNLCLVGLTPRWDLEKIILVEQHFNPGPFV